MKFDFSDLNIFRRIFKVGEKQAVNSKFAIVEGYKNARASLMFTLASCKNKNFAITSWGKGEGKSTAAANLALSFSKTEKRVLLIDADLRRPSVHLLLKLNNSVGFSNLLSGEEEFENIVHRNVYPYLDILPSGAIPPNPSELLCSPLFTDFIEKIHNEYDYIIIDTPPVGVVSDALLLKDYIGGYVLIVKERSTTHGDIKKAIKAFAQVNAKLLGLLKVGCQKKFRKYGKKSSEYYSSYY
ncbi:MAG: CpsD/CapB family tyrosine-protein kinase [Oscillospiraceae bacterium]|jgi:capsular exopolysaccharide synthesis family protein|nr:CpsD/CapB family tyrosine-protein kinase [Oscillospiraceae bacterium]